MKSRTPPSSELQNTSAQWRERQIMAESERLFPQTSYTLIHYIQHGEAKERELSLTRFCALYYPAIYGYARLRGLMKEDAQDRTQDFFVEVVRDELLRKYAPAKEKKFSSWLMACFKNMESNHRRAQRAAKRGGGSEFVSFDTDFAETCYQSASAAQLSAESTVDLTLARSIWRSARARLMERYRGSKDEALVGDLIGFVLHKRWPDPPAPSQAQMARKHATTSVRLKAFFNRALKRQAESCFREECLEANPGIKEPEIAELWALLQTHIE